MKDNLYNYNYKGPPKDLQSYKLRQKGYGNNAVDHLVNFAFKYKTFVLFK